MTALLAAADVIKYRNEVERAKLMPPKPTALVTLTLDDDRVRMTFFRPIAFMGMSPEQADELALGLKAWAKEARKVRIRKGKK